jgi:hypothetical protein
MNRLSLRAVLVVFLLGTLLSPGVSSAPPSRSNGLLPDLLTFPPANLYIEVVSFSDGPHYLLRFDNKVWNAGPGRLELEGRKRSKIYQNVYDAAQGGRRAQQIYIGNDSIFHEGHNHYHIENFASYRVIELDKRGTKTSFCIIDVEYIEGPYGAQYTLCDQKIQGMSVGWADIYHSGLVDQWVDLGTAPPADGTYTLESMANPRGRLVETKYDNNTAWTCFTISGGTSVTVVEC